jgi:hypothetical protein
LTNNWAESRLQRLEAAYKKGGRPRELIKDAFELCCQNHIPLPEWIVDGIEYVLGVPSLDRNLDLLEKAYVAGNLGALKDAVYWCNCHKQPLPNWAVLGLYQSINTLAKGEKIGLKLWRDWARQYRQNINDYEVYEYVIDAREQGAEWGDVYEIAAAMISNKSEVEGGAKANTIEKTYKRVTKRLKENPLQYYLLRTFQKPLKHCLRNMELWKWIEETILVGKPKGIKKQ